MVDWCEGEELDINFQAQKQNGVKLKGETQAHVDPLLTKSELKCIFIFIVEEGNVKVTTDAPVATTTTTTTTTPPPQRRKREVGK